MLPTGIYSSLLCRFIPTHTSDLLSGFSSGESILNSQEDGSFVLLLGFQAVLSTSPLSFNHILFSLNVYSSDHFIRPWALDNTGYSLMCHYHSPSISKCTLHAICEVPGVHLWSGSVTVSVVKSVPGLIISAVLPPSCLSLYTYWLASKYIIWFGSLIAFCPLSFCILCSWSLEHTFPC